MLNSLKPLANNTLSTLYVPLDKKKNHPSIKTFGVSRSFERENRDDITNKFETESIYDVLKRQK